jgi:NADPH:quinone reductase-like Zn-dependent oxidoreductase
MRAYELHPTDTSNDAAASAQDWAALHLVERASPALGPHDVRVRVRAVSLNYRDLIVAKNARSRPNDGPKNIPASDGAGEVIEIGSAVQKWRVGDRVAANFFPTWSSGPLSDAHHAAALGGQRRRHVGRRGGSGGTSLGGYACRLQL